VIGDANAGIVNNAGLYPTIDETTLRDANEAGGEANVSIGWHAIEFLLWGQDTDPSGPGDRPAEDFEVGGSAAPNQARRRQYLEVCMQLLIDDLARVRDDWAPGTPGNYRTQFLALSWDVALGRILTASATRPTTTTSTTWSASATPGAAPTSTATA